MMRATTSVKMLTNAQKLHQEFEELLAYSCVSLRGVLLYEYLPQQNEYLLFFKQL